MMSCRGLTYALLFKVHDGRRGFVCWISGLNPVYVPVIPILLIICVDMSMPPPNT